jgi:hypothetical protein
MSNPTVVTLQLTAGVANGIAASQTPSGAGNLTINGSLTAAGVATLTPPRRVIITSNGADGAVVFGLYGTNGSGAPISETITGVASTTVASVYDYATVTRISVSGATAGNITAGTNGTASTPWVFDDFGTSWHLSVACSITGTGTTPTFTVEHTYDDPNKQGPSLTPRMEQFSIEDASYSPPLLWSLASLTAKSINCEANYANQPIFAHRLTVTAGTMMVVMQSIQAGIGAAR